MRLKILCALLAGAGALAGAAGADIPVTPARFPWVKTLAAPPAAGRNVAAFALDEDLLAETEDDFANLRLFDEHGGETPRLLRVRPEVTQDVREVGVEMDVRQFEKLPDNRIRILLARPPNAPPARPILVDLQTPGRNFEKQVSVSGSADGRTWQPLVANEAFYDYSRHIDLRSTRVALPAGAYAFYRVEISNFAENQPSPWTEISRATRAGAVVEGREKINLQRADIRIDGVKFFARERRERISRPVTRSYAVTNLTVREDATNRETIVAFDLPRAPLTAITLRTGSRNFSRPAVLEGRGPDPAAAWVGVAQGRLWDIRISRREAKDWTLGWYEPVRWSHYRLRIRNGDNPPLAVAGVDAAGREIEALFFPEATNRYRVLYGGKDIPAPNYDTAAVLRDLPAADAERFLVGARNNNPAYNAAAPPPPRRFQGKTLLIAAIVAMVAALSWMIFKTVCRMDLPAAKP